MMNSFRQNRGRNKRRLLVITAFVALIFLIDVFSAGAVRAFFRTGALQVWYAGSRVGETLLGGNFFTTRRALEVERRALLKEVSQLKVRAAAFDILSEEIKSLRDIVHLTEGERGITAPIASSFRSSPYGTFLVGAGTEDGVRNGGLVVVGDPQFGGFVMGRIDDADSHISLVRALFAPGEMIDASVRDIGVSVEGRGGGQARAELPRDAAVEEGDVVVSAELGGKAIGIVGAIEKDAGGASQRIHIHFPVSFTAVHFVYVLQR